MKSCKGSGKQVNLYLCFRIYIIFASICLLFSFGSCVREHATVYKTGDFEVKDRGLWTFYPRYRVETSKLTLNTSFAEVFSIGKPPRIEYELWLIVESEDYGDLSNPEIWRAFWYWLSEKDIVLSVGVFQEDVMEPLILHTGKLPGDWYPGGHTGDKFFVGPREYFNGIILPQNGQLKIELTINNPSQNKKRATIQPLFVGGGIF